MSKRVSSVGGIFTSRQNLLTRVRNRKMRIGLALASIVAAVAGSGIMARAATLTWDPGFVPGTPTGGNGTWDLNTTGSWSNGASDVNWVDNSVGGTDVAVFNNVGGAVTFTNTTLSAMGLTFQVPGYTISGASGLLQIGTSGLDASAVTSGSTAIGSNITLLGAQSWKSGAGGNLSVTGNVTNGGFLLTLPGAGNTSISGIISGTGGIANTGTGTLTLGGANTFSGGVTLNTGTVIGNNATAFGSSVGTFVLGNAGATSTATVLGGSFTFANPINVVAGDTFTQTIGNTSGAAAVFSGPITLGTQSLTLTETGATGELTMNNVITGTGTITINSDPGGLSTGNNNQGQVALGAASPAFTGTYSINTGALKINGETNSANQVFVASGAMLDVIGNNSTIKELSGSGFVGITTTTTSRTLTLGGTGNSTFSGVIRNNVANNAFTVSLTVALSGGGIQTLSGADTYTGPTLISSGTLNLANANALQNTTVTINVANGLAFTTGIGTFNIGALSGSAGQTFIDSSAAAAATLSVGADNASTTYSGILSDGGSVHGKLIKVGTGVLTVGNTTIAYTGGTTIAGGGLAIPSSTVETFLVTNGLAMTGGFLQYNYNATPAAGVTSLAHVGLGGGSGFTVSVGAVNLLSPTFGGAGTVALGASTTISGPTTFAGGSVTFTGTTLSTFGASPNFTFNGGTLVYPTGNTSDLTAGSVTLAVGGGTLVTNSNLSFANPMSGLGGFTKAGTGTVTINAANTYAGNTSITAGVLLLNTPNALTTTGTVFVLSANGLQVTNAAAGGNPVNLGGLSGNATLSLNDTSSSPMNLVVGFDNANTTYSGIISGAGTLTKVGTGTLVLSAQNTFAGDLTVNSGLLSVTVNGTYPASGLGSSNTANRLVTINTGASVVLNSNGGIVGNGAQNTPLGFIINGGTLQDATGNTPIGPITFNGGTMSTQGGAGGAGGTQYPAFELGSTITVSGSAAAVMSGSGNFGLGVNSGAGSQTTFNVGSTGAVGGDLIVTAILQNAGASQAATGLIKAGAGTMVLGAANVFTGSASITQGVLQLNVLNALATSTVAVNTTSGLGFSHAVNSSGAVFTIGALSGIADQALLDTSSAAVAISLGATNLSANYSGVLSGTGSTLIKTGTGTQTLSGSNTYTGNTTITTGVLQLGAGSNTGQLSLSSSIVDNASFAINRADSVVQGVDFSGSPITGNGTVVQAGAGTLTLNAVNAYTGGTTFTAAGTVVMAGAQALGTATAVVNFGAIDGSYLDLQTSGVGDTAYNITSGSGANFTIATDVDIAGSGVNHTMGNASLSGGTMSVVAGPNVNGGTGTLTLGSLGLSSGTAGAITTVNPGTISLPAVVSIGNISTIGTAVAKTVDLDGTTTGNIVTGVISNGVATLSLLKSGSSTWTLANANTFTGSTSITGGTLLLGTANALSGSTVFVSNGLAFQSGVGTFNFGEISGNDSLTMTDLANAPIILNVGANTTSTTFAGYLSGTGSSLVKVGTGTLTLSGSNSYTGGTTISNGVLAITSDGAVNNMVPVVNGGTLQLAGYASNFFFASGAPVIIGATTGTSSSLPTGSVSGSSNLTFNGPGILVLNGPNVYTGGTTITAGVLDFPQTNAMPATGDVTVNAGSVLGIGIGFGSPYFTVTGTGAGTLPGLLQGLITGPATFPTVGVGGSGANVTIQAGAAVGIDTSSYGNLVFAPSSLGSNVAAFNFAKLGTGNWLFNDPTFTGTVTAISNTGQLQLDSGNAVQSGILGISNMQGSSPAAFTAGIVNFNIGGLSGKGTQAMLDVNSQTINLSVGGTNLSSTFGGVLVGSGTLTKVGTGTLVVSGQSSFTGDVTVNGGVISVAGVGGASAGNYPTSPLGATNVARNVTINTGGIVSFDANGSLVANGAQTTPLAFVINAGGLLRTPFAGNTPIGAITLNGGTINTTGGNGVGIAYPDLELFGTVTVGGSAASTITGTGALALGGFGGGGVTIFNVGATGAGGPDLTVSAPLAYGAGATTNVTGFLKTGLGTMALTAVNVYRGVTTINQGTLQLSGAGSVSAGTSFILNGGTFLINNTNAAGGYVAARVSTGATFVANGGNFGYIGNDAASSPGSFGAISGAGNSAFTVTANGFSANVTLASLSHSAGNGTDLVNGVGLGKDGTSATGRLILTAAPTLTGTNFPVATGDSVGAVFTKIVPFLVGEATSTTLGVGTASGVANTFVTYSTASGTFVSGLRPLNPTDEFTNNAIVTASNTYITNAVTVSATAAINSLVMNGATANLSISDGFTLTDTSGALLFATSSAISPAGPSNTGVLNVGGEGQITTDAGINATLSTILTGTALTKSGTGTLWLTGTNNMTGTTTVTDGVVNVTGTWSSQPGTFVVANGFDNAVMNVLPGATVTRTGVQISTGGGAAGAGAVGVLNQSGGTMSITGNTSITYGVNSYGYLKMSGGVYNAGGEFQINGANSSGTSVGIVEMSGGTLNAASWVQVSRSTGTGTPYALLNLTGGVLNLNGTGTNLTMTDSANGGATGISVINIANATIQATNNTRALVMANSGAAGRTDVVNLLPGGLLSIYQVTAGNAAPTAIFNFNGGTLQCEGPAPTGAAFMTSGNMDAVNVFSGGGTFDNNSISATIGNSLLAPSGNGLSSFNLTSGGAGYVGAPYVTFVGGGGVGATGYAVMSGGVVTSVVITSPGTDYTSPATVLFTGGGFTTPAAATVGMVANISGGMAFIGSGTTTLSGNNTYTGSTSISAGTLVVTGSISNTSNINVTNSTLNFSGSISATNSIVAGAGGKIINNSGGSISAGTGVSINGAGASFQAGPNSYVSNPINIINGNLVGSSGSTFTSVTVSNLASNTLSDDLTTPGSSFTITSLTFQGQATVNLNFAGPPPASPLLNVGTLVTTPANGKITIQGTQASWAPGLYDIIGTSTAPTLSDFVLGSINGLAIVRQTPTLVLDGTNLALSVTGSNPVWTGIVSGAWTTNAIPPNGSGNTNLKLVGSGTPTDYLESDIVLFDDTALGNNTALTITTANVHPTTVIFNNTSANYSISSPGGFGIGDFQASTPTTFTMNGSGTVSIGTANTYSGGTTVNAGQLNINHASAIGSGKLILAASTVLDNTSGSAVVLGTNNAQTWNGDVSFVGSNSLDMGSGAVTFNAASRTVNVGANTLSVGSISGNGLFTMDGAGTLVVGGSVILPVSATTGNIFANNGTLVLAGGTNSTYGNTTGNVFIAATSGMTGTVTLQSGTLNIGRVDVAGTGPDTNTSSGGIGILNQTGGVINANLWFTIGQSGMGTYNMSGGTMNLVADQFEVGNYANSQGTVNITGGNINIYSNNSIYIGSGAAANYNSGNNSINQSSGVVTFFSNAGVTVGGTGNLAIGQSTGLTGTQTYNLNGGSLIVGGITSNGGTAQLSFGGGTLKAARANGTWIASRIGVTINTGGATLDDGGFAMGIGNNISGDGNDAGAGLTKIGTGTLTLSGANTFNGAVNVMAGTLALTGVNTYGGATNLTGGKLQLTGAASINNTSGVFVNAGGLLSSGSSVAIAPAITVNNGALANIGTAVMNVNSVTFAGPGSLTVSMPNAVSAVGLFATTFTTNANSVTVNASRSTWSLGYNDLVGFGTLNGAIGDFTAGILNGIARQASHLAIDPSNGDLALDVTSSGDTLLWTSGASKLWTLTGSPLNWKFVTAGTPVNFIANDIVTFDDTAGSVAGAGAVTISTAAVVPTMATFNNNTLSYNVTGTFGITGAGQVIKSGTGTVTLSTANSYTGGTVVNGGALTMAGSNSFGTGFVLVNGGTATLSAANTYTGGTTVTGGLLNIGNVGALGSGPLVITGGSFDNATGSASTLSNNVAQSFGGTFTFVGSSDLNMGTSVAIFTTANTTVNAAASNLTMPILSLANFSAPGTYTLTKTGAGTITVSNSTTLGAVAGANSTLNVNGGTIVQTGGQLLIGQQANTYGILNINNATFNDTSAANFQELVVGGGVGFGGAINISNGGALNITGAGAQIFIGTTDGGYGVINQSGGTITAGNWFSLARGGGSGVYNMSGGTLTLGTQPFIVGNDSGGSAADIHAVANISGSSVINGTSGIRVGNSESGVMNISGGTITTVAGGFGIGTAVGFTGIVNLNGGAINSSVTGGAGTSILDFNGGTLRAIATGNLLSGLSQAVVYSGGAVLDDGGIAGVTVAQNLVGATGNGVTLGTVTASGSGFLGTPIVELVGGGGTGATAVANVDGSGNLLGFTITNPGTGYTSAPTFQIPVGSGGSLATYSISGTPVLAANTSGGLIKMGTGTLALTGVNTYTGGTTIAAGTLLVSGVALPAAASGKAVTVNAGGTYLMAAAGTDHTLATTSTNYFGLNGGKLNLSNNDMIITGGSASELSFGGALAAPALVTTGSGNLQVTTGVLTGAEYTALTGHSGLAATAASGFDSTLFAAGDLLFHYGMAGDVTFSGKINMDDYLAIDHGYGEHLAASYYDGDFNHDGTINAADYALIDYNYLTQSGPLADGEISLHTQEFGAAYTDAFTALSSGASAVPEPASLAMLGLGAVSLLRRRRRLR